MRARLAYPLLYAVPAVLAGAATTFVVAVSAWAVLWLFVFGDDTWPDWVNPAVMAVSGIAGLLMVGAALVLAARAGRRVAPRLPSRRHVGIVMGTCAALIALVMLDQAVRAAEPAGTYPPLPDGIEDLGGSCVGDAAALGEGLCSWSIGAWTDAPPTPRWVVAGRFIERVDRKARWALTDRIPVPRMRTGDYLSVALCEFEGHPDPRIVAIVDARLDVEWYTTVRWALRLDMGTGRFEPIDATKVRCANEGYGHEG